MILCITPNPAVDRTLILPRLVPGGIHRSEKIIVTAGGKGLNVARAIRTLGGDVLCMGFAGGHAGRHLADLAQNEGLRSAWTWTQTETRTCTILITATGDATVINETGHSVTAEDWSRLQKDVQAQVGFADRVCVSGSVPPNSSGAEVRQLLSLLADSGKQIWADTSGAALQAALTTPGICIKANADEIGQALGIEIYDLQSARHALTLLGERRATPAVITLGAAGALLLTNEGGWHARGPDVRVVSTVGSGDAFLAGLVTALDADREWRDALRDAVAAGTANVLSPGSGQFTLREFGEIREQVKIEAW